MTMLFMTNTIYGLASPFLPTLLDEFGVDATWTGLIFAMYAVASIITSLFVGKLIESIGHRRLIATGGILMALSIVGFGAAYHVKKKWLLILLFNLLRVGQGCASGMINTTAYAYASVAYPNDVEKIISLFEGVVGIGGTSGPILGSLVYKALGF